MDVDIGDPGIELVPMPNQASIGNEQKYQICCLDVDEFCIWNRETHGMPIPVWMHTSRNSLSSPIPTAAPAERQSSTPLAPWRSSTQMEEPGHGGARPAGHGGASLHDCSRRMGKSSVLARPWRSLSPDGGARPWGKSTPPIMGELEP